MNPAAIPPVDQLQPYVTLALTVFTTVVTGAVTLAPVVIPIIRAMREGQRDGRQQAVESDIKRAGLIAASVAANEIRLALQAAMAPDSPGGPVITAGERNAAFSKGLHAGLDYLKGQKLYDRAVDTYGGADRVEASLRSILDAQVGAADDKPVPTPSPTPSPAPAP